MTLQKRQGIPVIHVSFERQPGASWFSKTAYAPWHHHLRGVFFEYLTPELAVPSINAAESYQVLRGLSGNTFQTRAAPAPSVHQLYTRQAVRDSLYIRIPFPSQYVSLSDYLSKIFTEAAQLKRDGEPYKSELLIEHGHEIAQQFQLEFPGLALRIISRKLHENRVEIQIHTINELEDSCSTNC